MGRKTGTSFYCGWCAYNNEKRGMIITDRKDIIIFNQRNIAAYENLFTKHLSEDIFHPKNRRMELKVKCQRYTYLIRSWRSLLPQAR